MNSEQSTGNRWKIIVLLIAAFVIAGLGLVILQFDSGKLAFASDDANAQMTYRSPADAGAALAQATMNGDESALTKVLGKEAKALITSGENESDKAAMQQFHAKYQQMNRWVNMTDGSRILYIGADNFAFPVPLAQNEAGQWYFDAVAGADEIRAREIGRNELLAIDACGALASAEQLYVANNDNRAFTQRIISTPGKTDGLYWPATDADGISPIGYLNEFPKASLRTIPADQPLVVDGYELRILTAQGEYARGGAHSYIKDGKMTDGFAILATPVKYADTGIMSFMVNYDGIIYEADLGPDTAKIASTMTAYSPDDSWSPIE